MARPEVLLFDTAGLRRLWLNIHLWVGAGLVAAIVPVGLTGTLLVWHGDLDRRLYADRYAVSGPMAARTVDVYAASAQRAFGDRASLIQLRMPQEIGDPVVAVGQVRASGRGGGAGTLNAWIDPPTARVLAVGDTSRNVTMALHRFHGSLMMPDLGRTIVGWVGAAVFVSTTTGLWLWWPRSGGLRSGLVWRRSASHLANLHHAAGFWISLPLAIVSLSGAYLAFPQLARTRDGASPAPAPASRTGPFGEPIQSPRLTLAGAVALARAQDPDGAVAAVNVPTAGDEPAWRVVFQTSAPARPRIAQVVDATGEVRPYEPSAGVAADPFARWVRQTHDGGETGILWRVVISLAGVAPTVLGFTGVVMWLRRRLRVAATPAQVFR